MRRTLAATALAAVALAAPAGPAAALSIEAYAGIKLRVVTFDGGPALLGFGAPPVTVVESAEGDAATEVIPFFIADTPDDPQARRRSIVSRVTADSDGEGAAIGERSLRFDIAPLADADGFIGIELEAIEINADRIIEVSAGADQSGDIGAAFASILLQRSDFEGDLFFRSAFVNLTGVAPGEVAADEVLLPGTVSLGQVLIPQRAADAGPQDTVRFTLTLRVESFGLATPQSDPTDGAVIPVPPAAPLLALGLAALAALRRRRGR